MHRCKGGQGIAPSGARARSRFGPGRTHLHELLRRAIERGFTHFDFTIGDEPYKLDWADRQLALYDHLAAYTARGWLVASAVNSLRAAKRRIKTTPVLWHLDVKLRAFAGRLARTWKAPLGASE
jgi:CelD/BcsL family acetyltransferase involved in cellulose biosynthesis